MKLKFKVGDIVRVCTKRHGRDQFGNVGVVVEADRNNAQWPYTVSFHGHTTPTPKCPVNSYGIGDLELVKAKNTPTTASLRTVDPRGSQTNLILTHLKQKGSITQVEASALYRVRSLTRRIADLRSNYDIRSETKFDTVNHQRYVRYYYEGRAA